MAADALEGPEGVCWGMGGEGKNRPGGGGKLAPHPALLPRACVCAPGLSVFLPVPFQRVKHWPHGGRPHRKLASQGLETLLRCLYLLNPVGLCCRPVVGGRGGEETALAAGNIE